MKKIIIVLAMSITSLYVSAQTGTSGAAVQVAEKIAKKMKDSLSLTEEQRGQLYDINMQLHNQKQDARTQHTGNAPQTTTAIQNIEKTRDSLYRPILTVPQFDLYKQKKRNLVSNN